MKKITIEKQIKDNGVELFAHFPKDRIYTIHQNGSTLDKSGKGARPCGHEVKLVRDGLTNRKERTQKK